MKQITTILLLLVLAWPVRAQSKTTQTLLTRFDKKLSLYFYKNTLRMLNQKEDPEFDELIKNVEKLRFIMVNKSDEKFGVEDYKKLAGDYQQESYEPIVNSRFEGKNFDIFLKDFKGSSPGTVVLVNDSSSLFVLDIIGTIDVRKAGALFSAIDGSTDIGKRIKNFTNQESDSTREARKKRKQKNQ
ncbi:MAG: DUF4252 domain-containing protein [Cytophagales bacterium]|nr:DUF4252 domain-containing protein [Cytophagales bacterium]